MWRAVREVLALLLLVVLTVGCAGAASPSATADRSRSPSTSPPSSSAPGVPGLAMAAIARAAANPADAGLAAEAINDFGLELLREATAHDANAVLSPASIVLALAMARAGARGDTAAQMDEVMRGAASDDHASWLNALDAALAARSGTFKDRLNKDADVLLRIANQSFAQADFPWEASYLDALAARFGAGLRLVDFREHAEDSRRDVNAWVAEQTEDRIPELLAEGTVDELTRLVLVNAIYLKAAWFSPFEKEATDPGAFYRLDGSRIDVPTMHHIAGFQYAEGSDWQAVELPYVGRQLAMLIVLPDNLLAFEAALDGSGLATITAALADRRVKLSLPRFGAESKLNLSEVLVTMGMPLAFDPGLADFSGITPISDLYISGVIHQANIDVDEEGTEAAAATGVVLGVTSMPPEPVPMTVDRPFLFALRDLETGAILFLGRVVEPMERT
jgi:serpin B